MLLIVESSKCYEGISNPGETPIDMLIIKKDGISKADDIEMRDLAKKMCGRMDEKLLYNLISDDSKWC